MVIAAMGRSYGRVRRLIASVPGLMELNTCAASSLSLRERAGVRAPFATKPAVEKAAPFSTLLCYAAKGRSYERGMTADRERAGADGAERLRG